MHPYLCRHGGAVISSYAFFYGLGVAVAGLLFALLLRKRGHGLRKPANLFMLAAVVVVVGGRILYGIVRWSEAKSDLRGLFDLSAGGQILYGSIFLTVPSLWFFGKQFGMRTIAVLDAAAVGTPLGLVFGRIGCLCEGCCHGTVTDLPWAVAYPKVINLQGHVVGSPAFMLHLREGLIPLTASRSLDVHPVQVYEAVAMVLVFVTLLHLWRTQWFTGRLAPFFILSYCMVRFVLEFIRVQEDVLWGLTLCSF